MPLDMTTSAQQTVDEQNAPTAPTENPQDEKRKKLNAELKASVEATKGYRRRLAENWSVSIDYRRGKPFTSQSDQDQIAVNMDWPLTKTKQAALFSQVPKVRVNHHPESAGAGPWLAKYEGKLNDTLVTAGIEAVMEECIPDCVNAAGFGACIVAFESISQDKLVPKVNVQKLPPFLQAEYAEKKTVGGKPVEMESIPQIIDRRYVITRISPSDFLWPLSFTGSNFDNAPWLGRTGKVSWPEAKQMFGVKEEDKAKYLGEEKSTLDQLTSDVEKEKSGADQLVEFDEIFYQLFKYDSDATSFKTLQRVVFLGGKSEPVIDEPWKGQRLDEQSGEWIGALKYPIRVYTLAYITDEAIPPSDSAIGRAAVDVLNKSRGQVLLQRDRNIPIRWFDVNRVDPAIQTALMRGTWQHMIPVQGSGDKVIGEVAKSGHPVETPEFDRQTKQDLTDQWTIGPNQLGSGADVETKGESGEIASNYQTRIGKERARTASFFVGIAEVLGGLLCLYEDPTFFGEGFNPGFSKNLGFSILADSTVLVDANQRLKLMNDFMNAYAKSGFVALEPTLREIAILSGLDPNTVIKAPEPQKPVEPNISLRLTGAADMMNPLLLAFMLQSGQAPKPELIEAAKQLIQSAVMMPQPPPAPMGPDGQPLPPGLPAPGGPAGPLPPGVVPPPGAPVEVPPPAPPGVGEAHPELTILPKIGKRSESGGLQ